MLVSCNKSEGNFGITPIPESSGSAISPILISSSTSNAFGNVTTGDTVQSTITYINGGQADADINSLSLSGTGISTISDTCSLTTLAGSDSCSIVVQFAPVTAGAFNGIISLPYLGSDNVLQTHQIAWTGSALAMEPALSSAPNTWDFGSLATAATGSKNFLISNSNLAPGTIGTATIVGSGYSIDTDGCDGLTVDSGDAPCIITVEFSPLIPGSSLGQLTINYENADSDPFSFTVNLVGYGNLPPPTIASSPASWGYGNVATNALSDKALVISNTSGVPATIGVLSLTGTGYSIATNNCNNIVLPAASSCTVTTRFQPTTNGAEAGTLTIPFTSAQAVSYSTTVALTGTGIPPVVAFAFSGFTGIVGTDTTNLTSSGVTLQWTAQPLASYYVITQTGGASYVYPNVFPSVLNSYNVTGLTPNTTYQYKINAYDAFGTSDGNTNTVSITTVNATGATFNGWSDVVSLGDVYTDIGTVDNTLGYTGSNRLERNLSHVAGFDNTQVSTVTGNITVSVNPFSTGQAVKFYTDGGAPTGLTINSNYYLIYVNSTTVRLAATLADAQAGTPIIPSTVGSGNMTIMPLAHAKLGWESFTTIPSGVPTSYNIYRSTLPGSGFTLVGNSTSKSFVDYTVTPQTTYYYYVYPMIGALEVVASVAADSVIEVYIPPQNMGLVHRWITNREACVNLLGFTWPAGINRADNYSCAYAWGAGFAPSVSAGNKAKWDIGYSFVIDRWQSGCKFSTMGTAVPAGGANNDVYFRQGPGTLAATMGNQSCYIKDATNGWITEANVLTSSANRALMRTNYPGYPASPINQTQSYNSCATRVVAGISDSNGNTKMRLMRLVEANMARAIQGTNVNYRTPASLYEIFSGNNLPTYGSCNVSGGNAWTVPALNGVTPPVPSTYAGGSRQLMNGSILSKNCYSRYEITNLHDSTSEWTGTQYSAASAGTGSFIASAIDPADNFLENYLTNGTMGVSNAFGTNWMDPGLFPVSGVALPSIPMFGVRAMSVNAALGSRNVSASLNDFAAVPYAGQSYTNLAISSLPNHGVILNSGYSAYNVTYRFRFAVLPITLNTTYGESFMNYRCAGQVGP